MGFIDLDIRVSLYGTPSETQHAADLSTAMPNWAD
jgi:hypothetical protein